MLYLRWKSCNVIADNNDDDNAYLCLSLNYLISMYLQLFEQKIVLIESNYTKANEEAKRLSKRKWTEINCAEELKSDSHSNMLRRYNAKSRFYLPTASVRSYHSSIDKKMSSCFTRRLARVRDELCRQTSRNKQCPFGRHHWSLPCRTRHLLSA